MMFHGCFKHVLKKLQGYFRSASKVLERKFKKGSKEVSRLFQRSFNAELRKKGARGACSQNTQGFSQKLMRQEPV